MTIVVDDYVEKEGKWPSSWEDLASHTDVREYSMYAWPKDSAKIREFVTIDFHADPFVLSSQTVDDFNAIRPIGSFYPYKDYGHVATLLETLRKKSR